MSVGAEQYQGSVNIRLEEINNCGETPRDLVIPDCRASGKSGIHNHSWRITRSRDWRQKIVVMDSGLAASRRPGMTKALFRLAQ
jgi:hypothetical protein